MPVGQDFAAVGLLQGWACGVEQGALIPIAPGVCLQEGKRVRKPAGRGLGQLQAAQQQCLHGQHHLPDSAAGVVTLGSGPVDAQQRVLAQGARLHRVMVQGLLQQRQHFLRPLRVGRGAAPVQKTAGLEQLADGGLGVNGVFGVFGGLRLRGPDF